VKEVLGMDYANPAFFERGGDFGKTPIVPRCAQNIR
jgi:hypothetical protein